ncbi:MAG: tRNA dihydrouridine(20/20a) synthase DusA [Pseudomonadales bacterium]
MLNPQISDKLIAVAPMMAWTDRHCRFLHRLYSPSALLFTEMITTGALIHGKQTHQLDFDSSQHPVAVQFGGNNPADLAACAKLAQQWGYDEINLNVGCPSDRVQRGTFGACLMQQPELVAACVAAMIDAVDIPVTVKCRTGIKFKGADEHYANAEFLLEFVDAVHAAGCERVYLHARNAILGGLTPAQNRDIPPLQPERGQLLKAEFPELELIINGGITTSQQALDYLQWADGVMIGRAAYHNPLLMSELHQSLIDTEFRVDEERFLLEYKDYMLTQLAAGERLQTLVKHLLHSFNGRPGARRFRQTLSDHQRLKSGDSSIIDDALSQVFGAAA